MRKILLVIVLAISVLCLSALAISYAEDAKVSAPPAAEAAIADAGNTLCPVTGEPVDGVDNYVYNGKRYGLCCAMCSAVFAKDPAKYSALAEMELRDNKK